MRILLMIYVVDDQQLEELCIRIADSKEEQK